MKEDAKKTGNYYRAVGRRKQAVAVVKLQSGKGQVTVNGKPLDDYFQGNENYSHNIKSPLDIVSKLNDVNIDAKVMGGGLRGQADAIRLGISRALVLMSEDFRTTLKKHGFLTRDPRKKERKKPGLKKARKSPQFSKR